MSSGPLRIAGLTCVVLLAATASAAPAQQLAERKRPLERRDREGGSQTK